MTGNIFRSRKIVVASLLALCLILASIVPAIAVWVGNDQIDFIAVRYDYPNPGESTWYYQVVSGDQPAISHITFEMNLTCVNVLDAGTWDGTDQDALTPGGGSPSITDPDPTTGISGIKFDESFEAGETRYVYFTVGGNYTTDETVVVASKGGSTFDTAMITGPSTTCEIYTPYDPSIDIEKLVNEADADEAPGVSIVEGDLVEFVFVVTNTGNVALTDVSVADDVFGPVCGFSSLGAGESASCSISVAAELGLHTNLGVVTGVFNGTQVQDTDPANYTGTLRFIPNPAIDIEKLVNGQDADDAPGLELIEGDPVTFDFIVTNTGNVDLTDIAVSDDVFGQICGIASLAPGESGTCSLTSVAASGLHTNIGTVTGAYNGTAVSDNDPANYSGVPRFIPNPMLDLEKLVNGEDADEAPGPSVLAGQTVTFEFVLTNTGNVDLTLLIVMDNVFGRVCNVRSLVVGETVTCYITILAVEGQHTNTAKASGLYGSTPVSDTDLGHYKGEPPFVPTPAIDIEKFVNGLDADDSASGPTVPVGSQVTFTYVVTNIGNVPLTNILVADNMIGTICMVALLNPGESITCTKVTTAIVGQYMNIGKAGGFYGDPKAGGVKVSDMDRGHYFGY